MDPWSKWGLVVVGILAVWFIITVIIGTAITVRSIREEGIRLDASAFEDDLLGEEPDTRTIADD